DVRVPDVELTRAINLSSDRKSLPCSAPRRPVNLLSHLFLRTLSISFPPTTRAARSQPGSIERCPPERPGRDRTPSSSDVRCCFCATARCAAPDQRGSLPRPV